MRKKRRIGPYKLGKRLGCGGMGCVYRARGPQGTVAIKVMNAELADEPEERARFLQEAMLGERVSHPNLVRTLDHGIADGIPYLVMEYVAGRNLRQRLKRTGPLSESLCMRIALQAGRALRALHAAGVVHRDIKPENIILTDDGNLKLTDLGLACPCAGTEGGFAGTVLYAAPETFLGERPESTVDWYSLGLMLFELSTGEHPSSGRHPTTVMMRRLEEVPSRVNELNPRLSEEFAVLVAAMLEREPQERLEQLTPAVRAAVRTRCLHSAVARAALELRESTAAPLDGNASITVTGSGVVQSTCVPFPWRSTMSSSAVQPWI
ncbi:MAG: serine/threonine-protein kinase [Planctomycetota bacterium]|jgi:serine/threonine-protein kinase